MSRKQRDADSRQKEAAGNLKKWWSAMAFRLIAAMAMALACSFAYVLLLAFSSNPCAADSSLSSEQCRGKDCSSSSSTTQQQQSIGIIAALDAAKDEADLNRATAAGAIAATGTSLGRIVFGIAATARLWERRKHYVKLWWRPNEMRGFVWLDDPVKNWSSALPPYRISGNTSSFRYTHRGGRKAAIRISRIVSETFRVGLPDVDWFVMGDDDTVFVAENLVKVLSKYDHTRLYYIGSSSESHQQNLMFSYSMAYGGGGFAISYALASVLEHRHDECIQRYPFLYGSDDRMHACMAELGVPLTREPGFHQFDVFGDVSGLLSSHPIAPFITIHHLDVINPIFPGMNQVSSLRHLSKAIEIDHSGILQQSICYDRKRVWSVSVSFGYMVKVIRGLKAPRDLETPTRTFTSWNRRYDEDGYSFTSRPSPKTPCDVPVTFHMKEVAYASQDGLSVSNYTRSSRVKKHSDCKSSLASPEELGWIYVIKERADDSWFLAPRRQCCQILNAAAHSMRLLVRDCKEGELIG